MADKGKSYELYPVSIYDAYRKVMNLARDMNTYIQAPEIVLIGNSGHFKSAIIEVFLGHMLFDNGKSGWTPKRPIHLKLLSNPEATSPRITIKRDYSSKSFNADARVDLKELGAELQKRNSVSQVPLVVDYEYKDCWNVTLIDSPDLYLGGVEVPKGVTPEEVQTTVEDLARPPHRIIVSVEEAVDWGKSVMLEFAKSVDPKLDRTIFVYTKTHKQIKNFTETKDVNQFFTSTCQGNNEKSFFIDVIDVAERADYADQAKYREKSSELVHTTVEALEQLKFDRRYEAFIGVQLLRKHLWDATWKIYQDNIPTVQNRLRALKANSEGALSTLQGRLSGMDIYKLRSAASNFVMNFLQSIEKLIVGTLDGNPAQNGQTLQEEKKEGGEWYDITGEPIQIQKDWSIPYIETRIYGGQQFERLLGEFKAVADHIEMSDIPIDDIATSAGPQKLNNVSALAWSASDLARRQSQKAFYPLIDQLMKRAILIMQRLPDIAVKMMAARKSGAASGRPGGGGMPARSMLAGRVGVGQQTQEFDIGVDEFPYYTHHVKDLYNQFIETIASECKEKCMDEFFCTRLIYWDSTTNAQLTGKGDGKKGKEKDSNPNQSPAETKESVQALAANIFKTIKERITRNILLKCHNYFLVPMQSPLWGEIQGKVSVLSNQMLEELFEVTLTTQRLKDEEKHLQQILEKFGQQEASFQQASHSFSHPNR